MHVLEREQVVARPLEEVFEFFSLARNLEASATASGTRCRSARSASLRDA